MIYNALCISLMITKTTPHIKPSAIEHFFQINPVPMLPTDREFSLKTDNL